MILLCSNGLTSEAITEELQKHLSQCARAAIVVTADNVYKEKNYHVPSCTDALLRMGLSVEIVDIDKTDAKGLLDYDVVEFIGGNPFYLMKSIREHKAEAIMKTLAEQKMLIGWSAAAFVFGPSLELVNEYSPELNFAAISDLSGLSLTQVEVLPHYSRFLHRFDHFEERCSRYEKRKGTKVLRLNDGDGIFVFSDHCLVIRAQ